LLRRRDGEEAGGHRRVTSTPPGDGFAAAWPNPLVPAPPSMIVAARVKAVPAGVTGCPPAGSQDAAPCRRTMWALVSLPGGPL
jgi:hypothetical protein